MKLALTSYRAAKFRLPVENVASTKGGIDRGNTMPLMTAGGRSETVYKLTLSLKARPARATK